VGAESDFGCRASNDPVDDTMRRVRTAVMIAELDRFNSYVVSRTGSSFGKRHHEHADPAVLYFGKQDTDEMLSLFR